MVVSGFHGTGHFSSSLLSGRAAMAAKSASCDWLDTASAVSTEVIDASRSLRLAWVSGLLRSMGCPARSEVKKNGTVAHSTSWLSTLRASPIGFHSLILSAGTWRAVRKRQPAASGHLDRLLLQCRHRLGPFRLSKSEH